ncbi:UNVERIFIED_CONTAM: hypothetical protein FKN15_016832 [Acipenser sinensis]
MRLETGLRQISRQAQTALQQHFLRRSNTLLKSKSADRLRQLFSSTSSGAPTPSSRVNQQTGSDSSSAALPQALQHPPQE